MWRFVLTDLQHIPVGEILNASGRRLSLPLSRIPSLSFSVRLDNPLSEVMAECEGYIKAYSGTTLKYHGPIISSEEAGDSEGGTLGITSAGYGWVMGKRLMGQVDSGTTYTTVDRAMIAKSMIDAVNDNYEMGIRTLASYTSGSTAVYTAGPYKPLLDCINEVSQAADGFDWRLQPIEPSAGKVAEFQAAALFGSDKPDTVFEWGEGRTNITSYRRVISRETQVNKVHHVPDALPVLTDWDSASWLMWGLMAERVEAQLTDDAMRAALLAEHIAIRKNPRQVIEFTPSSASGQAPGRVPVFGVDYDLGDTVTARGALAGRKRFNGTFRVYGVDIEIDDIGNENVTLVLSDTG